MDEPRSRLTDTGRPPAGNEAGAWRRAQTSAWQVSHDVVWSDKTKEEKMAVDFDALDLVRTQNKARSYNTKLDGLVQENTELRTLVADLTKEMPEGNRKLMYQERLKKIENSSWQMSYEVLYS